MPYLAMKLFPRDEETKKELVEKLNKVVVEVCKCPPEAISISLEDITPEQWEVIQKEEIAPNLDKMYIHAGEKKYQ